MDDAALSDPSVGKPNSSVSPLELDAKLTEQEHRAARIWWNAIHAVAQYPRSDVRWQAAIRALVWHLVARAPIVAVAGGMAALTVVLTALTLIVAIGANNLLRAQNEMIDMQNQLIEGQRRSGLIFELTSILDAINDLEEKPDVARTADNKLILSSGLKGRIQSLSAALHPYRYISISDPDAVVFAEASPPAAGRLRSFLQRLRNSLYPASNPTTLVARPRSPERGQLLITLVRSDVYLDQDFVDGLDLARADAPNARLQNAFLDGGHLNGANLSGANLKTARMNLVELNRADCSGADFRQAQLVAAGLYSADLRRAQLDQAALRDANLEHADLSGAFLSGAVLEGTLLTAAELGGADLEAAIGLTQAQVDSACAQSLVKLPNGLNQPPPCSPPDPLLRPGAWQQHALAR